MEKYQFFLSGKIIKGKYQVFQSCFFGSFALLTTLATLVIFIDAIVREIGENWEDEKKAENSILQMVFKKW